MINRKSHVIGKPLEYAFVSVERRMQVNYAVYLSIACALSVPGLAYLCRVAVQAQGAEFGGRASAQEFASALKIMAILGGLVGFIQIALVLARIFESRKPEFELLLAIAATPKQAIRASYFEGLMHAVLGWCAAMALTGVMALSANWFLGVPLPAAYEFMLVGAAYAPLAILAVIVPSIVFLRQVTTLKSSSQQELNA